MKNLKWQIILFFSFLLFIVFRSSFYIVSEGEQAMIMQFGRAIGSPITSAGPKLKIPFIQDVVFVDKRILNWDGSPELIPTKDDKYIFVDTTARWKIIDALKFIKSVKTENNARKTLDTILDSATRDVISRQKLIETVRSSNAILKRVEEKLSAKDEENDVFGTIEEVKLGREKLAEMIVETASKELEDKFGIKLIDVQLRRISYKKSVEQKVYDRMISEKKRIAEKIRSKGLGEKAIIEGRLKKDLQEIESEADKQFKIIKGKAEAKATAIYAKTYSQSPEFFNFLKRMEAYKNSFSENTKFILSSDSEFLKYLK